MRRGQAPTLQYISKLIIIIYLQINVGRVDCPRRIGGHMLPQRKHTRLKYYDYSKNGYYFVTICTKDKKPLLGEIVQNNVGRGLAPAATKLNIYGKIVENILLEIPNKFNEIKIDKYVIMPNHIHAIISFQFETAVACPRPTLNDIIRTFKSKSTIACNQQDCLLERKIWQTSFYEHIIRNEHSYQEIWQYIDNNPLKWQLDKLYVSF